MARPLVALVVLSVALLAGCGSDEKESPVADTQTSSAPEESPEEDQPSACLGKKKGEIIKISAGDPKDDSQFGDFRFSPTKFTLTAGEFVTFKVSNPTSLSHTFTVESLECDTGYFTSGETVFVSFKIPKGVTPFRCVPHSRVSGDDVSGMAGEIVAR